MSKHTPGPWTQGKTTPQNVSAGSALICRTFARSRASDEDIANARLIAAAPDLLTMLTEAHEIIDSWGYEETAEVTARMRALIERAGGDWQ